ncbi:AMP-binding protein [Bosea sp. (in: a-proteobacteria)]|uniref:AMP-binding protein n=1 Tax=Bosea sp. (in: a-proteobacteria) TaxID=1871050 RepID=UPI0026094314|nr:AMP-binding protein [Bosea sp. (in: a-proteobacteria)]MCO5089752.1 AMP-binding protein [Bosea sp. (in: a-proteobacteria)]
MTADPRLNTLPDILCEQAALAPDAPFITVLGEGHATRATSYEAALRIAAGLGRLGVAKSETVAVMGPTSLATLHAWMGINCAGGIEVALNGAYRGAVLEHALNTIGAGIIIIAQAHLPVLRASEAALTHLRKAIYFSTDEEATAEPPAFARIELIPFSSLIESEPLAAPVAVSHTDIGSMIYTSGTSGPAKAVRMPFAQIAFLAQRTVDKLRLQASDRFYCAHPLFHMAGKFMGVQAMLMAGGSIVLDQRFDAAHWLDRVRVHGATVSLGHGPMVEMIHARPPGTDDREHLLRRMIMVPFPRAVAHAFEERFGIRGIECWGMTEINAVCWAPYDEPLRAGSCGKVDADWYDFRVVDPDSDEEVATGSVGEFVIRPTKPWLIMQGYHGMPDKTVDAWRNLWFHTGDAGYIDDAGYVYFVDRLGDRIRRRAENISSYDIESAASGHPSVAECAAVGVPSEFEDDDDVKLCVVLKPGRQADPETLLRHLARTLPHYMVPRYIAFLAALPRTPTNKIQKKLLMTAAFDQVWDRKASGVSLKDLARDGPA